MFGTISDELEVNVPASEAWKLYSTLQLAEIVKEALPIVSQIDIVQGDGGPGTILQVHFSPAPGASGLTSYKEKFTVVDDEKRVKEVEVVEGWYLDLGFTLYRVRFEIIDKVGVPNTNQCITKGTIEYEVSQEAASNASLVTIEPLTTIMKCAADYLLRNHKLTDTEI